MFDDEISIDSSDGWESDPDEIEDSANGAAAYADFNRGRVWGMQDIATSQEFTANARQQMKVKLRLATRYIWNNYLLISPRSLVFFTAQTSQMQDGRHESRT